MNRRNLWILIGIVVVGLLCGALVRAQSGQSSVVDDEALSQLAAIEPIDTHLHAYQVSPCGRWFPSGRGTEESVLISDSRLGTQN